MSHLTLKWRCALSVLQSLLENNNKKNTLVFGIVLILVLILALITYLFFWTDRSMYENADLPPIEITENTTTIETQEDSAPIASNAENLQIEQTLPNQTLPDTKDTQSIASSNTATLPQVAEENTITQLKYAIKPIDKNIASCASMPNGRWNMPKSCENDIMLSIQNLIDTNKELIALEVSGIVDNNPYSGPSAELKQEGLASFRAREAIMIISRAFSNVAVFEGLSIQAPNKRGFEVKAYYLQN